MKLYIPVASGIEATTKRQLKYLGYGDCPATGGRISLFGEWDDVARLNVFLRTGERVLIELASFHAETFDDLYNGVYTIPWEEWLTAHSKVVIDGKCVKSKLMAIKASGGVAKKAILNRMKDKGGARFFDEKGERTIVGVSIFEDTISVTLDTSGDGLHKRGYRDIGYDAPLKETTASALIDSSFFHPEKPFADVFCGSGTLPIEAAMISRNIAPGENRDFDFTSWKCAPKGILERAKDEAKDGHRERKTDIFASDISPKAISIAKHHAMRAGVADCIRFEVADMRNFTSDKEYGVMISNPPYGERLMSDGDLFGLYRDFGKTFRSLKNWSCYFLTSYEDAERAFSKKADKKRKLYNANLECCFYSYLGEKPPQAEK